MMDRQYKCEHFRIEELVPPEVFADRGQKAWQLLNPAALITLDQLREKYGPITINDWLWGGKFKYSGLRVPGCGYGSQYSQHMYGNAFDNKFRYKTPEEVRKEILANNDLFPYIMSIELDTPTWLHFDVRNCDRIMTYKP